MHNETKANIDRTFCVPSDRKFFIEGKRICKRPSDSNLLNIAKRARFEQLKNMQVPILHEKKEKNESKNEDVTIEFSLNSLSRPQQSKSTEKKWTCLKQIGENGLLCCNTEEICAVNVQRLHETMIFSNFFQQFLCDTNEGKLQQDPVRHLRNLKVICHSSLEQITFFLSIFIICSCKLLDLPQSGE